MLRFTSFEPTIPQRAAVFLMLASLCATAVHVAAQNTTTASPAKVTVFQNVHIFDGESSTISGPKNVLVRGNKIESISSDPIPANRGEDTLLIDGGGRTLMPGLIDAHWHTMLAATS